MNSCCQGSMILHLKSSIRRKSSRALALKRTQKNQMRSLHLPYTTYLPPFDNHSVKIQQLMQQQSTRLTFRQVQERNQRHDQILKENLVESPGREVAQSDVLQLLQITESKECKKLASGAIGRTFGPAVQFSRRKKVYQNI